MPPKLSAPMGSPEAPVAEMAAAVGSGMATDDGSETSDAELLSIVNQAMSAQGQRQTDFCAQFPGFSEETQRQRYARAKLEALAAGEVLPLKSEVAEPSLTPSSWTLLTTPSRSSAVECYRVVYDADGVPQARCRRSSPSTLLRYARTPRCQTL